jgi:hypothetical protein
VNRLLPSRLIPDFGRVLPRDPNTYRGPALAFWITAAYLVLITVRSVIHLVSPDGGAESIATIDTSVEGGANIIAIFGQWGAIQLLLAALLWVLVLRYRGLLPLALLVLAVEPLLRELAGALKPVETMGTAPGAALNTAAAVLVALTFLLSLCPAQPRGEAPAA